MLGSAYRCVPNPAGSTPWLKPGPPQCYQEARGPCSSACTPSLPAAEGHGTAF